MHNDATPVRAFFCSSTLARCWLWHDDQRVARRIEPGGDYHNLVRIRRGANGMAETDAAAVNVEPFAGNFTNNRFQPQLLSAIVLVVQCREHGKHLCGKSLVDFPEIDIADLEPLGLQQRRYRMCRSQSHFSRAERGPFGTDKPREHG